MSKRTIAGGGKVHGAFIVAFVLRSDSLRVHSWHCHRGIERNQYEDVMEPEPPNQAEDLGRGSFDRVPQTCIDTRVLM